MTQQQPPEYIPTPAEIRKACEAIRQTWPASRFEKSEPPEPVKVPVVNEREMIERCRGR